MNVDGTVTYLNFPRDIILYRFEKKGLIVLRGGCPDFTQ